MNQWTYTARIFQTSDGLWYFQVSRESEFHIQVLTTHECKRLVEALEVASTLKIHVTNISELPLTQYLSQVA